MLVVLSALMANGDHGKSGLFALPPATAESLFLKIRFDFCAAVTCCDLVDLRTSLKH